MPDFGFPAQPRQALLNRIISDLRDRGDDARIGAVTGRFADVTTEREGRVEELMHIEKSINDLQVYNESIALAETRAGLMQDSMASIANSAQKLSDTTLVLQTNATEQDLITVSGQARDVVESIVAKMNAQFAGRSLFAGDDGDAPAMLDAATIINNTATTLAAGPDAATSLATLQTDFIGAGGLFETTYYTGGTGSAPMTEIAPGERVDYGVKADETAFRSVLMNASILAASFDLSNAIPANQRRTHLDEGATGLRNAITDLAAVQARLGTAEARIASMKSRNIASEAALSLRYNDLAGTDQFEATLQLTELDSQIETALATSARLSNLSLINFL